MQLNVLLCDTADEVGPPAVPLPARRRPTWRSTSRPTPFRAVEMAARTPARRRRLRARTSEGLGGVELIRRLHASSPASPRSWSGRWSASPDAWQRCSTAGAAGYLTEGRRRPTRSLAAIRTAAERWRRVLRVASRGHARRASSPIARSRGRASWRPSSRDCRTSMARGHLRQGRLPREHLPRTPDPGHGREGHRLRAPQPVRSPTTSAASSWSSSRRRSTS